MCAPRRCVCRESAKKYWHMPFVFLPLPVLSSDHGLPGACRRILTSLWRFYLISRYSSSSTFRSDEAGHVPFRSPGCTPAGTIMCEADGLGLRSWRSWLHVRCVCWSVNSRRFDVDGPSSVVDAIKKETCAKQCNLSWHNLKNDVFQQVSAEIRRNHSHFLAIYNLR